MNKYHSKKIATPDGKFDSKKEHRRWLQLKMMQEEGLIKDLRRQVPFELIPSQKKNGKVVERPVKYVADFVYTQTRNSEEIVEDTKGFKTPDYIIKRKLMLYTHNIEIREV